MSDTQQGPPSTYRPWTVAEKMERDPHFVRSVIQMLKVVARQVSDYDDEIANRVHDAVDIIEHFTKGGADE